MNVSAEKLVQPGLKAEKVTVTFRDADGAVFQPLHNFDLTIRGGEITCILGPSGCGKTTLLRTLGGFIVPEDTGGILYKGQYLTASTPDIVLIFQENNLYPWLTVRGNVNFGVRFRRGDRSRNAVAVDEMLAVVGLADAVDRYPHQLSGGMRQRAAIARALVSDPKLLLLDEPFSALDISLRRRMQQLVRDIWTDTGKTMVMVTHNVEEAIMVGHRVIVLGGQPAQVIIDESTEADEFRNRYSAEFLSLQKNIEDAIY